MIRKWLLKLLLPKKYLLITLDKYNNRDVETTFNDNQVSTSGNAIYLHI